MSRDQIFGLESNSATATGTFKHVTVSTSGTKTALDTVNISQLIPEIYDYISLSYTGDDLTGVIYKVGGSSGTTVATLALTYLSGVLQTVTRT